MLFVFHWSNPRQCKCLHSSHPCDKKILVNRNFNYVSWLNIASWLYLGPSTCTVVAQKGGSKKPSRRTPKRSKKPTEKDIGTQVELAKEQIQEPKTSIGSHRQGIGLNDIPIDLGEVFSDPLLEENETTEFPTDENSWKHAVECALEEVHSQVKYSKSQFSWMKPFKNTSKSVLICQRCDGTGMMTCEYCHGQGFVRFGPGNNFRIRYRQIEVVLPRRVWGDLYYCPVCGGLRRERCITCYGNGTLQSTSSSISTEDERIESLKTQQVSKRGKHRIYFLRDINKEIEEKLQQLGKKQGLSFSKEEDIDFLE